MASVYFIILAFPCTVTAIFLAVWHIYKHLLHYSEPTYQRYIVRIIFMVPVYAIMSFLSLVMSDKSIYFNSVREIYEAWVIYNFLSLCLAWVGGPGVVVTSLNGQVLKPSWHLMTCCLHPIPLDGRFIRRCKQGGLQFVILKPILVAITFILHAKGKYADGNFSPKQAYLYITIIYTMSYSLALYALLLFYVGCKDLLRPFHPVPKFVIIKSVVFLTYWQGVLVFLAAKSSMIRSAAEAADIQNLVICLEMAVAAVGHLYAFPYQEYAGGNVGTTNDLPGSLSHAIKFNDFYQDTVHQFAPTYHDYVLYSNGGEDGTRKYRATTFVPTSLEMGTMQKHKQPENSREGSGTSLSMTSSISAHLNVVDAEMIVPKDPESMKSSLLLDPRNEFSRPYDVSPLASVHPVIQKNDTSVIGGRV